MNQKRKPKKTIWDFIRECPLVSMVILSVIGYTIYTIAGAICGEYKLKITKDHTIFMSAMIKEDPFMTDPEKPEADDKPEDATITDVVPDVTTEEEEPTTTQAATGSDAIASDGNTPIPTTYETVAMRTARSPYYDDNNRVAMTTNYDYIEVKPDYFNDAAFIGDSRIEGLHDYGTLRTECSADFYYKEGVSIWNLMTDTMANNDTVPNALSQKQYKKIFIMCGVNELGNGFANDYKEQYKKVLDEIQNLQPDATIFILGMMHVTQNYSDNSDVFNNDNIDCRNALIAEYADGMHIFYLDMNPVVCDMNGNVPGGVKSEYSNDGIHLQAQYYALWEDFMLKHGLRDNMFQ